WKGTSHGIASMTDTPITEAERPAGEAVFVQPGLSDVPRKPVAAEDRVWLGFDLGGTKMNAVLFDRRFEPLARRRKKTRGAEGAAAGVERIRATIEKLLEEASVAKDRLGGIGVGCPGPLDLDEGVILAAPNLGWKD